MSSLLCPAKKKLNLEIRMAKESVEEGREKASREEASKTGGN